jgi:hypothetical protein
MKTYTLQASMRYSVQAVPIEAIDDESAMMFAIDQILGRAKTSSTWAKGLITLSDPDGNVIQTMDAKPGAEVYEGVEDMFDQFMVNLARRAKH